MKKNLRVAIAGGGTGGHLYPALSVADAIREMHPESEFLFFGTSGKIEATVVPQRGYPFTSIWISGLHRSFRLSNLIFPLKLIVSLFQALASLRSFKPDLVLGTGGYVCGPVLLVASWLGIPTVIHESNSYPGVTTRLLASRMDLVLAGSERTLSSLPRVSGGKVVGTPVRLFRRSVSRTDARKKLGLDPQLFTVFVLGGSQGAASINKAVDSAFADLQREDIQVLWQTGRTQEADIKRKHGTTHKGMIHGFIEDMETAFAAADLVVSRAGASTLAEVTAMGVPSILVPYPHAAGDHQTYNAAVVVEAGGAIVISDADVAQRLGTEINALRSDRARLERMRHASATLGRPDAAVTIAHHILGLVRGL